MSYQSSFRLTSMCREIAWLKTQMPGVPKPLGAEIPSELLVCDVCFAGNSPLPHVVCVGAMFCTRISSWATCSQRSVESGGRAVNGLIFTTSQCRVIKTDCCVRPKSGFLWLKMVLSEVRGEANVYGQNF